MFTGLVVNKLPVAAFDAHPRGARLAIDVSEHRFARPPAPGDSIAVAGVCLTVTEADATRLGFDVITETLNRTTLGRLEPGHRVNIEPSLAAGDALGGHFVQGHVDALGRVRRVVDDAAEYRITIEPESAPIAAAEREASVFPAPADVMDLVAPKGSIAVDGVSMTIASVTATAFDIALIPTTLELTTLGELAAGDRVNLETDIIARSVVHYLRRQRQGGGDDGNTVDWDTLRGAGFVND